MRDTPFQPHFANIFRRVLELQRSQDYVCGRMHVFQADYYVPQPIYAGDKNGL